MSTLTDFTPTTLDDIADSGETSPEDTIKTFESITAWETSVSLPGHIDQNVYVSQPVGPDTKRFDQYGLLAPPESDTLHGLVGILAHINSYTEDTNAIVFKPAGDPDTKNVDGTAIDEETSVKIITDLQVTKHDRNEHLDTIIDEVRTALTDTDWVNGDTDTSVGEWHTAMTTLMDFRFEHDTLQDARLVTNHLSTAEITHAVARYPLYGQTFMSQVTNGIERHLDGGVQTDNPEAIRELIFEFADTWGISP